MAYLSTLLSNIVHATKWGIQISEESRVLESEQHEFEGWDVSSLYYTCVGWLIFESWFLHCSYTADDSTYFVVL
jgi:hypothetical protein